MRDAPPPESIEVLAAEVRAELSAQQSQVESLDAKAGVLLGLAGLFVALGPSATTIWADAARFSSVVSAGLSLVALAPRYYSFIDLRVFRFSSCSTEPVSIRLSILDTQLVMLEEILFLVEHKSRRLRDSIGALFVAIILATLGSVTS